jgi:hypothetical protein
MIRLDAQHLEIEALDLAAQEHGAALALHAWPDLLHGHGGWRLGTQYGRDQQRQE